MLKFLKTDLLKEKPSENNILAINKLRDDAVNNSLSKANNVVNFVNISYIDNSSLEQMLFACSNEIISNENQIKALNPSRRNEIAKLLEKLSAKIAIDFSTTPSEARAKALEIFANRTSFIFLQKTFLLKFASDLSMAKLNEESITNLNWKISEVIKSLTTKNLTNKDSWTFAKQNIYSWFIPSKPTINLILKELNSTSFKKFNSAFLYSQINTPVFENITYGFDSKKWWKQDQFTNLFTQKVFSYLETPLYSEIAGKIIPKSVLCFNSGSGQIINKFVSEIKNNFAEHSKAALKIILNSLSINEPDNYYFQLLEMSLFWDILPMLKDNNDVKLPDRTNILNEHAISFFAQPMNASENSMDLFSIENPLSKIRSNDAFDLIIGDIDADNDILEKFSAKKLKDLCPEWKDYVDSHSSAYVLNIALAISKLRENGFAFLSSKHNIATIEGGDKIRAKILDTCQILEIIEVHDEKFSESPFIYVLQKCSNNIQRTSNRIKMIKVSEKFAAASVLSPQSNVEVDIAKLVLNFDVKNLKVGEIITQDRLNVSFSALRQGELPATKWISLSNQMHAETIKHLNSNFKKLGEKANIYKASEYENANDGFTFSNKTIPCLQIRHDDDGTLNFTSASSFPKTGHFMVPTDIDNFGKKQMTFLASILNSKVLKFWCKYHFEKKADKLAINKTDIKLMPIVEFPNSPFIDKDLLEKINHAALNSDENTILHIISSAKDNAHLAEYAIIVYEYYNKKKLQLAEYAKFFKDLRALEIDTNKISKIFPTSLLKPIARQQELFIDLSDCKSISDFIIAGIEKRENKGVGGIILIVKSTTGSEIRIGGPISLLNILEERIPEYINEYWIEVAQAVKIPGSTEIFIGQINAIKKATKECLDDYDLFLKSLDKIIFKLFDIESLGDEAIETINNSL